MSEINKGNIGKNPGTNGNQKSKYQLGIPVKKFYFYEIANKDQNIFSANKKVKVGLILSFSVDLAVTLNTKEINIDSSESKTFSSDYKLSNSSQYTLLNDDKMKWEKGKIYLMTDSLFDGSRINLPIGNPNRQVLYIVQITNGAPTEYDDIELSITSQLKTYSVFTAFDIHKQKNNIKALKQTFTLITKDSLKADYFSDNDIEIQKVKFSFDPTTILNKIITSSKDLVDLELDPKSQPLLPMLVQPVQVRNKTYFKFPWLDLNISLPVEIALLFSEDQDLLSTLFPQNTEASNDAKYVLEAAIICSSLLPNMKNIPRTPQGTPNEEYYFEGITDPNDTTRTKIYIAALESSEKSAHVTGIIDSWFEKYPNWKDNQQDELGKTLKAAICALSEFIVSDYSISGGGIDFNKAFLPWYLSATTSFNLKEEESKKIILSATPKATCKSLYFDLVDSNNKPLTSPKPKRKITNNISETISLKELNNEITLPLTEQTLEESNISTIPSDISGSNEDSLKYLCLLPIYNDKSIKKIFSREIGIIPANTKNTKTQQEFGGNVSFKDFARPTNMEDLEEINNWVKNKWINSINNTTSFSNNTTTWSTALKGTFPGIIFDRAFAFYYKNYLNYTIKNGKDFKVLNEGTLIKVGETQKYYLEYTLNSLIGGGSKGGLELAPIKSDLTDIFNTWMWVGDTGPKLDFKDVGLFIAPSLVSEYNITKFISNNWEKILGSKDALKKQIAFYYNIDISDVNIFNFTPFSRNILGFTTSMKLDFTINQYKRTGLSFSYSTKNETGIIGYNKETIFDIPKWQSYLINSINIDSKPMDITFISKYQTRNKINQIDIHNIAGQNASIEISFNKIDNILKKDIIASQEDLNTQEDNTNTITSFKI